jgi:uncharacterized protein
VFTQGDYLIGIAAALIVGLSKTALPGAGLLATPLLAMVFTGRAIPGATIPILLVADLFAVTWYRRHARLDVLKPLVPWVGIGYLAGAIFFIIVGKAARPIELMIGGAILVVVVMQIWRMLRQAPAVEATTAAAAGYGISGGFTTFVSNNAGPIMNTYLMRLGLDKHELVGTTALFYFLVNASKVPVYWAIGQWSEGGHFFSVAALKYDLVLIPAIVFGVFSGKFLFTRLPQKLFRWLVVILAGVAAIKLLVGA